MDNMITDMRLLRRWCGHNQDALDALERLVEYVNTLEVKETILSDWIDEHRDLMMDEGNGNIDRIEESVNALRLELKDAESDCVDNYGLLEEQCVAVGTVNDMKRGERFFATEKERDDYYAKQQIAGETLQTLKSLKVVDIDIVTEDDETCFGAEHIETRS